MHNRPGAELLPRKVADAVAVGADELTPWLVRFTIARVDEDGEHVGVWSWRAASFLLDTWIRRTTAGRPTSPGR